MDPSINTIKDVIVAIGGLSGITTLAVAYFERRKKQAEGRKIEADYSDQISSTAIKLVEPLRQEVERLNKRVFRLEHLLTHYAQRITYLMGGIDKLMRQLCGLDAIPVWTPNQWDPDEEENDA